MNQTLYGLMNIMAPPLGALLLSTWGGFQRRIYTSLMGLVGMDLGVTMIGLTPAALFPVALAAR